MRSGGIIMGLLDRFRRKKKQEITPGGSPIYRYEDHQDKGFQPPQDVGVYLEEIEAHFDQLFPGRENFVYHEILSDIVHIDIHIMKPTAEQPFYVVFTTGMSDLPMTLPDEIRDREDLKYGELYLFLPGNWQVGGEGQTLRDVPSRYTWPIVVMKFLARFPHEYQTWLGFGHTIPNGAGYEPFDESVGFGGVALSWGDGPLSTLKTKDGKEIHFYQVIPAYKEEIEYKLKYGMSAFLDKFNAAEVGPILDPNRPNLCADFKEILDG